MLIHNLKFALILIKREGKEDQYQILKPDPDWLTFYLSMLN